MLKARHLHIDTFRENIVFLHIHNPLCRSLGLKAAAKVRLIHDGNEVVATLNLVEEDWLGLEEAGLSQCAWRDLKTQDGKSLRLRVEPPPRSIPHIQSKLEGMLLDREAFGEIVGEIVAHRLSRIELTAFVTACAQNLSREEILWLTQAMASAGRRLTFPDGIVVDKHCIGGVPGNRTTPIIVAIAAAHGLTIPKTSSRAITSPAGTADTMECLCRVDLTFEEMRDVVQTERGCLVWGGGLDLSPADDTIIQVERPLGIDSPGQLVASILSKKWAAGSTHVLVDIPVSPRGKIKGYREAMKLRKIMEFVALHMGLGLECVITAGDQPIGRGIGPALEARDVVAVLAQSQEAPKDLKVKALKLAGRVLEFDPAVRGGGGLALASEILTSGRALDRFNAILEAQGRRECPPPGEKVFEWNAPSSGLLQRWHVKHLNTLARLAGAPAEARAGLDLLVPLGHKVAQGQPILRIYAVTDHQLEFSKEFLQENEENLVEISP